MKKQSLKFLRRIGLGSVGLMAVAMLSMMSSCSDDNENVIPDPFDTTIKFSAEAKDTTLVFNAYAAWKASSSKEDMLEILSAKNGIAGEVKMNIRLSANTGFVPRTAEIRITDGRAATSVFKVEQAAALRDVNFSKGVLFTQKGELFADTVVVTSNTFWEIKSFPAWVKEWKMEGDKTPEEGVDSEITLIFVGDHSKFTPAAMKDNVVFADAQGGLYELPVEFAGFTPYINFELPELKLEFMEAAQSYRGKIAVTSNIDWKATKIAGVDWIEEVDVLGDVRGNALESENTVWVIMDMKKLDSAPLDTKISFKDSITNTEKFLVVKFLGTGNGYFDFEREKIFDKKFDGSAYDSNGSELPDAVLDVDFEAYAADHDAYEFLFIRYDKGFTYNQEATWCGVDPVDENNDGTRSPITGKKYSLWVQDRNMGMGDKTQERTAMMFMVPKGTTLDDLFQEDSDDLKEEWEGQGTFFTQKGVVIEYFLNVIDGVPEGGITLPKEGGTREILVETDCMEGLQVYTNGEYDPDSWAAFDLSKLQDEGKIILNVGANNTNTSRVLSISFVAWRGEGVEDQVLYTFTLRQEK